MMYVPKDEEMGRYDDGYIDVVDRDGWNHLGYFSPLNSSTPQYVTGGNWEVTGGIAAFDKSTNLVYFPTILHPLIVDTSPVHDDPPSNAIYTVSTSPAETSNH